MARGTPRHPVQGVLGWERGALARWLNNIVVLHFKFSFVLTIGGREAVHYPHIQSAGFRAQSTQYGVLGHVSDAMKRRGPELRT